MQLAAGSVRHCNNMHQVQQRTLTVMPCLTILYSSCMLGVLALVSGSSVLRLGTGSSSHQGWLELLLAAMPVRGHKLGAPCVLHAL